MIYRTKLIIFIFSFPPFLSLSFSFSLSFSLSLFLLCQWTKEFKLVLISTLGNHLLMVITQGARLRQKNTQSEKHKAMNTCIPGKGKVRQVCNTALESVYIKTMQDCLTASCTTQSKSS